MKILSGRVVTQGFLGVLLATNEEESIVAEGCKNEEDKRFLLSLLLSSSFYVLKADMLLD